MAARHYITLLCDSILGPEEERTFRFAKLRGEPKPSTSAAIKLDAMTRLTFRRHFARRDKNANKKEA